MQNFSSELSTLLTINLLLLLFVILIFFALLFTWIRMEKFETKFVVLEHELREKFDKLPSNTDLTDFFNDSLINLRGEIESQLVKTFNSNILPGISGKLNDSMNALFKKSVLPYLGVIGQKKSKSKEKELLEENPVLGLLWDEIPSNYKKMIKRNPEMVATFTDLLAQQVMKKLPGNLVQQVAPLLGYEIHYQDQPKQEQVPTQPKQEQVPTQPKQEVVIQSESLPEEKKNIKEQIEVITNEQT